MNCLANKVGIVVIFHSILFYTRVNLFPQCKFFVSCIWIFKHFNIASLLPIHAHHLGSVGSGEFGLEEDDVVLHGVIFDEVVHLLLQALETFIVSIVYGRTYSAQLCNVHFDGGTGVVAERTQVHAFMIVDGPFMGEVVLAFDRLCSLACRAP